MEQLRQENDDDFKTLKNPSINSKLLYTILNNTYIMPDTLMRALLKKVQNFPAKPGVYLMKNTQGKVVYIGKARNLRARVSDYFGRGRDTRYQIDALMKNTADIEYILTATEKEALLLEYNLIQEHKPRYNVSFKDSKRYVNIKLGTRHKYPGIYVTRLTPQDGSNYFGPYTSAASCRETVDLITKCFKIRNCGDRFFANRSRPCIQYEIGKCTAPCVGYTTEDDYKNQVRAATMFLKGDVSGLIKNLERDMERASEQTRYEDAAHLRDVIKSIKLTIEPQAISGFGAGDKDYIGTYKEGERAVFTVLKLRGGKIKGWGSVDLKDKMGDAGPLWEQFLLQCYRKAEKIPAEIHIDYESGSLKTVQDLLSDRKGSDVRLKTSKRGADAKRIAMARANAKEIFKQRHSRANWQPISRTLMGKFGLTQPPSSIECVDISNISGKYAVGSMVTFTDGKPAKEGYRRFKIRTKEGPDDYGMMREVLKRRYVVAGNHPDLLLIDGGKGQLMIAKKVLEELGLNIPAAAIAKGKDRRQDQIFLPGRKNPVKFKKGDAVYLFLQRVRDEAHRFGITYYRKRHRKGLLKSELDDIPGIGPAKRKALLKLFGSVEEIKKASAEEIAKIPGITTKLAKKILS